MMQYSHLYHLFTYLSFMHHTTLTLRLNNCHFSGTRLILVMKMVFTITRFVFPTSLNVYFGGVLLCEQNQHFSSSRKLSAARFGIITDTQAAPLLRNSFMMGFWVTFPYMLQVYHCVRRCDFNWVLWPVHMFIFFLWDPLMNLPILFPFPNNTKNFIILIHFCSATMFVNIIMLIMDTRNLSVCREHYKRLFKYPRSMFKIPQQI